MENMVTARSRMNLLITGGAGFIGQHLTISFTNRKVPVCVVDIKKHIPESLSSSPFVNYQRLDVTKKGKLHQLVSSLRPTYIIHLAALSDVTQARDQPFRTILTNVVGTASILEVARNCSFIKGVIVASSDKAYGSSPEPYTEHSSLNAHFPYDASKACADLLTQAYAKTYDLPVIITRFGNVYGEGDMNFNRLIPGLCKAIIKNEVFYVRSDGSYVRDYIYINDVLSAYQFMIKHFPRLSGNAYNFSSSDTLSVRQVIKKAGAILKKDIPFKMINRADKEIPYQHLDDTKIRKLGWKSTFRFDDTFPTILQWFTLKINGYV